MGIVIFCYFSYDNGINSLILNQGHHLGNIYDSGVNNKRACLDARAMGGEKSNRKKLNHKLLEYRWY